MPSPLFGASLAGSFDHGSCNTKNFNAADNVFFQSYLATLAASGGAFDVSLDNGTTVSATGIESISDDVLTVTTAGGFGMLPISQIDTILSATQPPVVVINDCCSSCCH